jgi:hypothetical protein
LALLSTVLFSVILIVSTSPIWRATSSAYTALMFLFLLAQMEPACEQAAESNIEIVKTIKNNGLFGLLFITSPFVDFIFYKIFQNVLSIMPVPHCRLR